MDLRDAAKKEKCCNGKGQRVWVSYRYVDYEKVVAPADSLAQLQTAFYTERDTWLPDLTKVVGAPTGALPTDVFDHLDYQHFYGLGGASHMGIYLERRLSLAVGIACRNIQNPKQFLQKPLDEWIITLNEASNGTTAAVLVKNQPYGGGWPALEANNLWIKLISGEVWNP
jgi:hypothetical protein